MYLSLSFTLSFYFASFTWMRFYTQWVWEFSLDTYCVAPGGLVPFLRTSFGTGFVFQWLHHAVRWYSSYLSCFCDKNTWLKKVKEEVVYIQGKQLLSSLFLFQNIARNKFQVTYESYFQLTNTAHLTHSNISRGFPQVSFDCVCVWG